jgi:hypothetical protein
MGGDGKTTSLADCPRGSRGWTQYAGGALASAPLSPLDLLPVAFIAGGLRRVGTAAVSASRDVASLAFTKTAAQHAASRPYQNSSLLIQEIMRGGKPIADPGGIIGGLRRDVPGHFGKSEGVWELVVNPKRNEIVHFLFKSRTTP